MKRFGLSKQERIKSRKLYEDTYLFGKRFDSENKLIRASFLFRKDSEPISQISFAISKKAGNAVWRNRIRRIIKEIYRLNKINILNAVNENEISLSIIFITAKLNQRKNNKICYQDLEPEIVYLLKSIQRDIEKK